MTKTVECNNCSKKFPRVLSQVKDKNFCSYDCFYNYKRSLRLIVCTVCSRKYKPHYKHQKYCSNECSGIGRKGKTRSSKEVVCDICSKKFMRYNYLMKDRNFCSYECYHKSDRIYSRATWTVYKDIKFRSTYEAECAEIMDNYGVEWIYEPKRFKLGWTTYMPDFYLPEFNIYLEVKGWMMKEAQMKIDSFRALNYNLVIVRKEDLMVMSTRVGD
jgi:hypothetical protein